jgi:hypothetical protein
MMKFEVEKSYWGEGAWQTEPDSLEFTYKGYKCRMSRNIFGSWCGYVAVALSELPFDPYEDINVHGGVTYNRTEQDGLNWIGFDCGHYNDFWPAVSGIHKKREEDHRKIYEKFSEELKEKISLPKLMPIPIWESFHEQIYRDVKFVKKEIRSMVRQIIKLLDEK